MTAHKQEVRDFNNVVTIAIITIVVNSPGITNATAKQKLKDYIIKYAANRKHSVYLHENTNVISATVIFNSKGFKEVDISREVEAI